MSPMAARPPAEPGEHANPASTRGTGAGRALAAPPSARYAGRATDPAGEADQPARSALAGPLVRALVIAAAGAAVLFMVGGWLASTVGLLAVSGLTGAGIGLVLARAAVPGGAIVPRSRGEIRWLAIGLAVGAVVVAAIGTWLYAQSEGGVLGPIDYLLTTFGPFVPAELLLAGVAAAWGASAGPVQS